MGVEASKASCSFSQIPFLSRYSQLMAQKEVGRPQLKVPKAWLCLVWAEASMRVSRCSWGFLGGSALGLRLSEPTALGI